jgi:hypothetical protein
MLTFLVSSAAFIGMLIYWTFQESRVVDQMGRILEHSFLTTLALTNKDMEQQQKVKMYQRFLMDIPIESKLLDADQFFKLLYQNIEQSYKYHPEYDRLISMTMELQTNYYDELKHSGINRNQAICSVSLCLEALKHYSMD